MLEAYTALGFLARATSRVRLGALVSAVHFREPGLLLKAATTLDVLSGGRAYLGLGAGWYEEEATGLGIPFPARSDRFRRLEDTLRFAHQVWAGDRSPFEGRTMRAAGPILNPPPVSRPHPPIIIGGEGERTTLRLVARYADACNIGAPVPGESRRKLAVLRSHCEELGRSFEDIEKTSLVEVDLRPGHQTVADVIAAIRAQADEGIEHVIVNMPDVHDLNYIRTFRNEIIPSVEGVAAGH
jgi:alkanesulfonate monooxygenase SsuD/methylene tetrahydromethanopterin reductase-like flavin-dependent oxidoreductase (luciferase family)